MKFTKSIGGIVAGALASGVVAFVAATIGVTTTLALVPALTLGGIVALLTSVHNHFQPQGRYENAVFGAVFTCVGYLLMTGFSALNIIPGLAIAAVTGVLVGWIYSVVSDSFGA